jgi:flagellar basal body rod protein FlgG
MEVSQRIAVSGMLASQRMLDVVSNNLANVDSTGFKAAAAHTTDIGYQAGLTAPVGPNGTNVRLVGIGEGTQLSDIQHDFLPGALQSTGQPLDLALQGDGFFSFAQADGTTGYTRDGSFSVDATGQLVTQDGLPVQSASGGNLVVPQGSTDVQLDDQGNLLATDATGAQQVVGQLAVSQFPNNAGLQTSGQGVWTATPASGAPIAVAQGAANAPVLVSGAVEGSNVNVASEFTRMIQAQRGYQLNSKVVQAWDDLQRMANDLRSA